MWAQAQWIQLGGEAAPAFDECVEVSRAEFERHVQALGVLRDANTRI